MRHWLVKLTLVALVTVPACSRASADQTTKSSTPYARYRDVAIPADSVLVVRVTTPLDSRTNHVEDQVMAELATDLVVDGVVVLPAGSQLSGEVTRALRSGDVKGRAVLAFQLNRLRARSEAYPIHATYERIAPATKGEDAAKIAVPAAGGAIVGGILGGKKGAVIGGAVGGGAGTAVVLSTSGKEVSIPAGTLLHLQAGQALHVRVPVR